MAIKGVLLLLLCVFDTLLLAVAASECPAMFISGTDHQESIEGEYHLTEGMCNGRAVYIHSTGDNYLYFISGSTDSWMAGPNSCIDNGVIKAYDSATYPQDVTSGWSEDNGYNFVSNDNIKVECYTECPAIVISGTHYQTSQEGEYYPTEEVCNERMVYKHGKEEAYLYFMLGSSSDFWLSGPIACGDSGGIRAYDNAIYPHDVTAVWQEYGYDWKSNTNINVECNKGCGEISITGTSLQELSGTYMQTENVCNNRLVYQLQIDEQVAYLSYYVDPGTSGVGDYWKLSSDSCETATALAYVVDDAHLPEYITAIWMELVGGIFIVNPGIAIACFQEGQDSLSSWEIAGIVIGCLVFIVLVGACVGKKEEVKSSVQPSGGMIMWSTKQ